MQRLALDHLTAVDTTPVQLVEAARSAGCDAVCLFLQSMDVLPLMPPFDLYADVAARRALRRHMADFGITLDLAYPFTLSGRTLIPAFDQAMECAAYLGAFGLNVLLYDRDPVRRVDLFGQFCDRAASFGLKVAVEFYPPSQIPSLAAAIELIQTVSRPDGVGINVDLLHLMRSGGTLADLAAAPPGAILYGQLCDGPAVAMMDREVEASSARLLAGEGAFDLAGFARALPEGCPVSVEIPRDAAVVTESSGERAGAAAASVRRALAP